jgi:hypothetical protein
MRRGGIEGGGEWLEFQGEEGLFGLLLVYLVLSLTPSSLQNTCMRIANAVHWFENGVWGKGGLRVEAREGGRWGGRGVALIMDLRQDGKLSC